MADVCVFRLLLFMTTAFTVSNSQSDSTGQNIYTALDGLGCGQFKYIIKEGKLENLFASTQPLTLFVFNDTAYANLPAYRQTNLYTDDDITRNGAQEYVNSFTLYQVVDTSSFTKGKMYTTASDERRTLFLDNRRLKLENVASGTPGPTKYFANGAMIIRNNIRAGQHMIHILDRALEMQWAKTALAYAKRLNPKSLEYQFYTKLMNFMQTAPQDDSEYNYYTQVNKPLGSGVVTFFLPSDEALGRVPQEKLSQLIANPALLLKILTLHIIPDEVLYTSMVNHNEGFQSQMNSGRVIFRKSSDRQAVYATGSLNGDQPVTARIGTPDKSVINGVIHEIDAILGFVYKSAVEEIEDDPNTRNFDQLLTRVRASLKSELSSPSGVTIFVPSNAALMAIDNVHRNYINNQSLINRIMEFSMLQRNQRLSLTDYNGGYDSYISAISRHNGRRIKAYSEGNDTWVEGGYVKARVIKPDIGVTNGVVHQIDAVFGIPTRDMPYAILCEDWLEQTYIQLQYVGLTDYMRDPMLTANQACVHRSAINDNTLTGGGSVPNTNNQMQDPNNYFNNPNGANQFRDLCGGGIHRCEFTMFVPNGTAIEAFSRTQHGRAIMNDRARWRWLLRRLMTFREKIYMDTLAPGAMREFISDNGEVLFVKADTNKNIASGQRTAYVMFQGARAEIIHSDLGATNGVYHIINSVLFVSEDSYRDVSHGTTPHGNTSSLVLLCCTFVLFLLLRCGWQH